MYIILGIVCVGYRVSRYVELKVAVEFEDLAKDGACRTIEDVFWGRVRSRGG